MMRGMRVGMQLKKEKKALIRTGIKRKQNIKPLRPSKKQCLYERETRFPAYGDSIYLF